MCLFLLGGRLVTFIAARHECVPVFRHRCALGGVRRHGSLNLPVLIRLECTNLALAINNESQRNALHAPRAESAGHLLPQHRADHVTHDAVQDAARLLRVHAVDINRPGRLERLENGAAGDLIKLHTLRLQWIHAQEFRQVPGDRFALTVQVGCEPDLAGILGKLLQCRHLRAAVVTHFIGWLKVVLQVNARHRLLDTLGGTLGEVSDVPLGGFHLKAGSEVLGDGLRFGGTFHDHQLVAALGGGRSVPRFIVCGCLCRLCWSFCHIGSSSAQPKSRAPSVGAPSAEGWYLYEESSLRPK